jgi:hypothetical protein
MAQYRIGFDDRFRSVLATAWDERRPAFVEGQLKRGGRRWVFSTVSHIDTLPEDLDDM